MLKQNFNCTIAGLPCTIVNRGEYYQAWPLKKGHPNIPLSFVVEQKRHSRQQIIDCLNDLAKKE